MQYAYARSLIMSQPMHCKEQRRRIVQLRAATASDAGPAAGIDLQVCSPSLDIKVKHGTWPAQEQCDQQGSTNSELTCIGGRPAGGVPDHALQPCSAWTSAAGTTCYSQACKLMLGLHVCKLVRWPDADSLQSSMLPVQPGSEYTYTRFFWPSQPAPTSRMPASSAAAWTLKLIARGGRSAVLGIRGA